MSHNKETIKVILDKHINIDDNYKKIMEKISRSNKQKICVKRFFMATCVFFIIFALILNINKYSFKNYKANQKVVKKDNIVINNIEIKDNNSMIHGYKSKSANISAKYSLYSYLDSLADYKLNRQEIFYNDNSIIYFGSYSYSNNYDKFLNLYISDNSLFESFFKNTKASTINNRNLYIINYDGIIFMKILNNKDTIVIQTNITKRSAFIDVANHIIKYQN